MRPSAQLVWILRAIRRAAVLAAFAAPSALAQSHTVKTPSAVLSAPKGATIGSVRQGVDVRVLETRGAYAKIAVGGYVERSRLSAQRGSAATRVGSRAAVIRSSAAASARTLGSFDAGTTVRTSGSATKGWVRVSREGWVLRSALERVPTATAVGGNKTTSRGATVTARAKSPPAKSPARKASTGEVASAPAPTPAKPRSPAPAPAVAAAAPVPPTSASLSDSTLVPTSNIPLRAAPDARPVATIAQGTTLTPLARERGWVRVRIEGWVPERDVAPADTTVRSSISAADLRADPQSARGKVVRWSVQVLAKQKADALRRDLAPDETYLLARGPFDENALLYLVVPPSLMTTVNAIPELTQAMVTARVRTGKSDLVGVPILDLLTIAVRK